MKYVQSMSCDLIIGQTAVSVEYCEYTNEMKQQVSEFCEKALVYGFNEQFTLHLPENQKVQPAVLQAIGAEFPHVALQSRAGSLQFARHPNMDPLSEIVGSGIAPSILSFITTSKMDKESMSPHTFTLPAMDDKEKRRACHLFFRQKYPYVKTSTSGNDNRIVMTIFPSRKRSRKNQKSADGDRRGRGNEDVEMPEEKRVLQQTSSASRNMNTLPLQFVLKKTNFELMSLRIRLSQLLHISQRSIGFAGIKDKKAITYQFATIIGVEPEDLLQAVKDLPGVEVSGMKWVEKPLEIGQLWGNRFHLKLRHCSCDQTCFGKAVKLVSENGFVNYYGTQRFGSDGEFEIVNATVGLLLMQGDWSRCLQYLLTPGNVFTVCDYGNVERMNEWMMMMMVMVK